MAKARQQHVNAFHTQLFSLFKTVKKQNSVITTACVFTVFVVALIYFSLGNCFSLTALLVAHCRLFVTPQPTACERTKESAESQTIYNKVYMIFKQSFKTKLNFMINSYALQSKQRL